MAIVHKNECGDEDLGTEEHDSGSGGEDRESNTCKSAYYQFSLHSSNVYHHYTKITVVRACVCVCVSEREVTGSQPTPAQKAPFLCKTEV